MGPLQMLVGFGKITDVFELANIQCVLHVFDNHFVQPKNPAGRTQQGLPEFCRDHDRNVLMFRYGLDFAAIKIAIIENILHRKHRFLPLFSNANLCFLFSQNWRKNKVDRNSPIRA